MKRYIKMKLKDQRGVTAVIVALVAVILFSFAALAIDIGYSLVTKNELQNVADAAALAAARQLGANYSGIDPENQSQYIVDPLELIAVAKDVALQNQAGGKFITINDGDGLTGDIVIGQWNASTRTLTPGLSFPDAVRVIARRDSSTVEGPITTFFARIFGRDTVNVNAVATAALSSIMIGKPSIPVGISKHRFETEYCDKPIVFYPTWDPASCGGWHTFDDWPANANKLGNILDDLADETYDIPETIANVTQYVFIGGTLSTSVFPEMYNLWNTMRTKNDGEIDMDDDDNSWTTMVVVYDSNDCSNPSGWTTIVGFAVVKIDNVIGAPTNKIQATIQCDIITSEVQGGGVYYGAKADTPNLVE
ncbi:MAG: pilus assembly protein TadG-related protein [Pseudomonadota bacterium]